MIFPVSSEHAPALEAIEAVLLSLLPKKDEKMLLVQQIAARHQLSNMVLVGANNN